MALRIYQNWIVNQERKSETTCSGTIDPLDKINVEFSLQWMESWNTSGMEVLGLLVKKSSQVVSDQTFQYTLLECGNSMGI